jgi:MFS family permease
VGVVKATTPAAAPREARAPLEALNFFMADMQAGVGPFLGVFLSQHGWRTSAIGTVMTLGGVAGVLITAPAGAIVDHTRRKRTYVILSGLFTVLASALIWVSQSFWVIAGSQVATAVAGAAIGPAVVGIALGIVRQQGFNQQNGRNQAFNHAGNMVGAGLSGLLGWKFGLVAVFWLAAVFAGLSVISVLRIPRRLIDDKAARGLDEVAERGAAKGLGVLFESKPLLVLAVCLALFHLGNGGLLPLYGLAVVQAHQGDPAGTVALTIVVAQAVMVLASLVAMGMAQARGYWLVILITFIALPIRGLVAASIITGWGVYPVQVLDGIGAGLQSVAVSGLVARVLAGTGRVNVGQGAVLTVQGVGASLSPALGGWIAQGFGYPLAFLIMGGLSLGSLALWLGFSPMLQPACAQPASPDTADALTADCA